MAARHWTDEQRERQSAAIRSWRPWEHSTGARTPAGKAVSSQNVIIGLRNREKALAQAMQELHAVQAKIRKLTAKRGEWWS